MKYAMLVYREPDTFEALPDDERVTLSREFMAVTEDPRHVDGAQLETIETATTVRLRDERIVTTDGPFADTKEFFAGYYLFEADGLDAAIEIASRIPVLKYGGSVEIRPVVER